ncbi:MAG: ABC transporter ATP-binding protein [Planctomycetota bacterium]|nr:ABC transporter ATP-binding protein [Planctomycetota bacterium]
MDAVQFEEQDYGKVYDKTLARRIVPFLAPFWRYILASALLLIVSAAVAVVAPTLIRRAIDVNIPAADTAGLAFTLSAYILLQLLLLGSGYLQSVLLQITGQRAMAGLKRRLFGRMMDLSIEYFDRNPVGRLMSRVNSDVDSLQMLFTSTAVALAGDLLMFFGMMGVMLWINWKLAVVTFSILPMIFALSVWFQRVSRPIFLEVRKVAAEVSAFLAESIQGVRVIQSFGAEDSMSRRMDRLNERVCGMRKDAEMKVIFFFNAITVLESIGLGLLLWYGGGRAVQGAISIGTLVLFISYVRQFFGPIRGLSDQVNVMQRAFASAERVFSLLDLPPKVAEPATPIPWAGLENEIKFEDVSFSYDDKTPVLCDVSFTVRKGERIAIVGPTGGGKTTIISLLCRFYDPQKGRIALDGIDIRGMRQADLRSRVGLVLQDVFVFPGDMATNVSLGAAECTAGKIEDACRAANLSEYIDTLPAKHATELSERGQELSTGQRQLLSIARAFAYDPQILVLDEATSSVDPHTEALIQSALQELMAGRTSIVIAHRLSTIRNADRILVIQGGKVVESGTHEELLARNGMYGRLYELQEE